MVVLKTAAMQIACFIFLHFMGLSPVLNAQYPRHRGHKSKAEFLAITTHWSAVMTKHSRYQLTCISSVRICCLSEITLNSIICKDIAGYG